MDFCQNVPIGRCGLWCTCNYGTLLINVQTQDLPLGSDCIKYMTITPKAPPEIDKWMIDPPVSNTSNFPLAIRDFVTTLGQSNDTALITTSKADKFFLEKIFIVEFSNWGSCAILYLFFASDFAYGGCFADWTYITIKCLERNYSGGQHTI
jgi:hypothetical protein